jgi:L-ribulokinase
MMGLEAGQSAFGDSYAWFRNLISWPLDMLTKSTLADPAITGAIIAEISGKLIDELCKKAADLPVDEDAELGLDWLNGRRTPDANQLLKSAICGLQIGTDAPRLFRAIAESTCFGAKAIVERFQQEGITVKGLIGLGGVAKKSPYIMQLMANIIGMNIRIHQSDQTCATGAAMFAATAAGIYEKVEDAMNAMGQGFGLSYQPQIPQLALYEKRFLQYKKLGNFIESNSV